MVCGFVQMDVGFNVLSVLSQLGYTSGQSTWLCPKDEDLNALKEQLPLWESTRPTWAIDGLAFGGYRFAAWKLYWL